MQYKGEFYKAMSISSSSSMSLSLNSFAGNLPIELSSNKKTTSSMPKSLVNESAKLAWLFPLDIRHTQREKIAVISQAELKKRKELSSHLDLFVENMPIARFPTHFSMV